MKISKRDVDEVARFIPLRHGRLTNSPARTNVALLIRRAMRLAYRAHAEGARFGKGRVLARLGRVGEMDARSSGTNLATFLGNK